MAANVRSTRVTTGICENGSGQVRTLFYCVSV